jgi:response regulator RpfG family c-di-GMP phosphodiesterase
MNVVEGQEDPSMIRLLLISVDKEITAQLTLYVSEKGFSFDCVDSDEQARQKLEQDQYDLVISEVHLVTGKSNSLLHWLYQNSKTKVILITEFGKLSETQVALQLGCESFLPKPFTRQDFGRVLKEAFLADNAVELDVHEYARVAIDDFIYGAIIPFSIHVRLRDKKFVKVATAGENADLDLIDSLKSKGLTELWLRNDDFQQYLETSKRAAMGSVDRGEVDKTKRARLIKHACEVATENLRMAGISDTTLGPARDLMISALEAIGSNALAVSLIQGIERRGSASYHHAVSCGIICGMMEKIMGWISPKKTPIMALGGFFHDVGLNFLPLELQNASLMTLSLEQQKLFESHPQLGAAALMKIPNLPREVTAIVMQHHENCLGDGFPAKLTGEQIFPMARVVGLVDQFCDLLGTVEPRRRTQPLDVLNQLLNERPGRFDARDAVALKLLLTEPDLVKAKAEYNWVIARIPKRAA